MEVFGPIPTVSLGGKRYILMVIDDYTRCNWVFFLASKDETSSQLIKFFRLLKNEKDQKMKAIKSDHGRVFDFSEVDKFYGENGINYNFSAPGTPKWSS